MASTEARTVSACVIQITPSIPGLNFLTETIAAIVMFGLCGLDRKSGGFALTPLVKVLGK